MLYTILTPSADCAFNSPPYVHLPFQPSHILSTLHRMKISLLLAAAGLLIPSQNLGPELEVAYSLYTRQYCDSQKEDGSSTACGSDVLEIEFRELSRVLLVWGWVGETCCC